MRGLATVLFIASACDAGAPPVAPIAPSPAAAAAPAPPDAAVADHAPFAIFNMLVDEHGNVTHTFSELARDLVATPTGVDTYKVGDYELDARSATLTPRHDAAALLPPSNEAVTNDARLVRYGREGSVRWTVQLHGARTFRPPDTAVDSHRVVVAIGGDVIAFDADTGKEAWRAPGDFGARLAIHDGVAYYLKCSGADHQLIGRATADGAVAVRIAIGASCDPWLRVGDQYIALVADRDGPDTVVYDLHGRERYRIPDIVGDRASSDFEHGSLSEYGGDELVVSNKRIARLDDAGHERWSLPPPHNNFMPGNDVLRVAGGGLVIANYAAISDDGVDLRRIDPDTGAQVWRKQLAGLGVAHSEYYQWVYTLQRGTELFVVSQASGGAFFERLSIATGARELRCTLPDGRCVVPRD